MGDLGLPPTGYSSQDATAGSADCSACHHCMLAYCRSDIDKLLLFYLLEMVRSAIGVAALAVLATCIGSAQGEVVLQQDEFDATGIEAMVQAAAEEAVLLYDSDGKEAFEDITGSAPDEIEYPTFVLNSTTGEIEAYAGHSQMVGSILSDIFAADRPYDEIMQDLRTGEGAWITSPLTNQETRTTQMARVWMTLSDGYVFAAGYYLPDFGVKSLVGQVVSAYDQDPDATLARINSLADEGGGIFVTATDLFQVIVADSEDPDRVGDPWYDHYDTNRSVDEIIALLFSGTWVNNLEVNPATGTEQIRRSWVNQHSGIIFTTGYFIADSEARSVVDLALLIYENDTETAFDWITLPDGSGQDNTRMGNGTHTDIAYPFVINGTTHRIVAHGTIPEFVDECCSEANQETGDLPLDDVIEEIREDGSTWVAYEATNPDTGTVQEKRTWLSWHDGFIFGSGYYTYDSQVQAIVAHHTFAYADHGDINRLETAIPENPVYHFVIDPATMEVVAHGGGPELAADDSLSLTAADRATTEILADLEGSSGAWSKYATVNPETGLVENKISWLAMYGGYVFGAGYYDSDLG